jgi:hypothetical protein
MLNQRQTIRLITKPIVPEHLCAAPVRELSQPNKGAGNFRLCFSQ